MFKFNYNRDGSVGVCTRWKGGMTLGLWPRVGNDSDSVSCLEAN